MTQNPGARIVNVVNSLKKEMDKVADELEAKFAAERIRSINALGKIEDIVHTGWSKGNDELEDFINQLSNNPPDDGGVQDA